MSFFDFWRLQMRANRKAIREGRAGKGGPQTELLSRKSNTKPSPSSGTRCCQMGSSSSDDSDLMHEATRDRNNIVSNLVIEIDLKNEILGQLQIRYNEKTQSLSRMLEEKDELPRHFFEETRRLQRSAREHIKRVLDE